MIHAIIAILGEFSSPPPSMYRSNTYFTGPASNVTYDRRYGKGSTFLINAHGELLANNVFTHNLNPASICHSMSMNICS
jgi:hypothetical protein